MSQNLLLQTDTSTTEENKKSTSEIFTEQTRVLKLIHNNNSVGRIRDMNDIKSYFNDICKAILPVNDNAKNLKVLHNYEDDTDEIHLLCCYNQSILYLNSLKEHCDNLINNATINMQDKMNTVRRNINIRNDLIKTKKIEDEKNTIIEKQALANISKMPDDIIRLIAGYAITTNIKYILYNSIDYNNLFSLLNSMKADVLRQLVNKILHKNGTLLRKMNRIEYNNMNKCGDLSIINRYKQFARSTSKFTIIVQYMEFMKRYDKAICSIGCFHGVKKLQRFINRTYQTILYVSHNYNKSTIRQNKKNNC
jgi:hypothetical protein